MGKEKGLGKIGLDSDDSRPSQSTDTILCTSTYVPTYVNMYVRIPNPMLILLHTQTRETFPDLLSVSGRGKRIECECGALVLSLIEQI
jgi:hypothetical protein